MRSKLAAYGSLVLVGLVGVGIGFMLRELVHLSRVETNARHVTRDSSASAEPSSQSEPSSPSGIVLSDDSERDDHVGPTSSSTEQSPSKTPESSDDSEPRDAPSRPSSTTASPPPNDDESPPAASGRESGDERSAPAPPSSPSSSDRASREPSPPSAPPGDEPSSPEPPASRAEPPSTGESAAAERDEGLASRRSRSPSHLEESSESTDTPHPLVGPALDADVQDAYARTRLHAWVPTSSNRDTRAPEPRLERIERLIRRDALDEAKRRIVTLHEQYPRDPAVESWYVNVFARLYHRGKSEARAMIRSTYNRSFAPDRIPAAK